MRDLFYKLVNNIPTPCSIEEYGIWSRDDAVGRNIFRDIEYGFLISTVFLGLDHSFGMGSPRWFETMIFAMPGGVDYGSEIYCDRYETYEQARDGHMYARRYVKCLVLL